MQLNGAGAFLDLVSFLCVVRRPFSTIIYELYIQLASTFEDCLRQSLYELVTLSLFPHL